MIDGSAVKEKMLSYISESTSKAIWASEFAEMGGAEQVSSCLGELVSEGHLFEVEPGAGIYTKEKEARPYDFLFIDDDDDWVPLGLPYTLRDRLK